MKRPPLWKLKRELTRPFKQLRQVPYRVATYLFGARYYDLLLSGQAQHWDGKTSASRKTAIFLIFPNFGVKASHLHTLRYLVSKGYAPVVISNLPISEAERADILDLAHKYIERPNFGYDFGGYRDGVLALGDDLAGLDRLLFLNDSAWFPLPGANDWLDEAEALQVDFAAAASNYGHPRVEASDFQDIKWNYSTAHPNFHYCSFALLCSTNILRHPGFWRFWKRFPLTNDKARTVKRGEIALSGWVLSNGFSHGVTCDIETLDRDLAALGHDRLRQITEQLILPEAPRLRDTKRAVLSGDASLHDLVALNLTSVAGQGSSYALAAYTIQERGFPFLKKSPCWLSEEGSDLTIELASDLKGPIGNEILTEALELRRKRAPEFAVLPGGGD